MQGRDDYPEIIASDLDYKIQISEMSSQPAKVAVVATTTGSFEMDRINEVEDAELIELGAVSVETKGGAPSAGEPDGRFPGLGIAED